MSYEGRRLRRGISSDSVIVPTAQERMGDFSAGPAFSGTLNDAAVAEALNTRPGCPAATAAAGGAPIVAGTAYAAIFPGNSNGAAPAAGGARRSLSAIAAQFHYSEGRL